MQIVIATDGLGVRGGVHSYLDAIIPEIVALEHEVHVVAPVFGRPQAIRRAGAEPHTSHRTVPGPVDGVLAFLDYSALEARAAHPRAPLVAVSHGPWYAQDVPTALAQPCALVALSDPSEERLSVSRAALEGTPIVRLTQPAEFGGPPAENLPAPTPRYAVFVSHRLTSRRDSLELACAERGITPMFIGGHDSDGQVLSCLAAADFVGGIGRVIIEAMALGRPAVVLDEVAEGRWVTPDTYRDLEASNFFLVPNAPPHRQSINALLDTYRPEYGRLGRELALANHAPGPHAARLLSLLRGGSGPARPVSPSSLRREATRRRAMHARHFAQQAVGWATTPSIQSAMAERARADALAAQASALHAELDHMTRSASWRATAPLRWLRNGLGRR